VETDTRTRILDAAEQLFVSHGLDATTLRMITAAAQANLAAVNYHFGSKEALVQEVFRRRLDWLNDERMRVLNAMEAEADGKPLKPSQIVDGFFGTLLRMADDERRGGITFLRLLGRMLTDPSEFIRAFFGHEYSEVIDRYKEALFKALPDVPKAEIVWRFHFMLGATSYAIAGTDALRVVTDWQIEEADATDRLDRLVPRLMSFLLGGLRAPLPQFSDAEAVGK
jgi:AcrR family transcriptional regulator